MKSTFCGKAVLLFFSSLSILLFSCAALEERTGSAPEPSEDFIIDDIETHSFPENETPDEAVDDDPAVEGAAFVITVSSDEYSVQQNKYYGVLQISTSETRRNRMMAKLSRYNRKDLTRKARLLISISPNSGRMIKCRMVRSSYVSELDAIIMSDIQHVRFLPVRGKVPSVLYVAYIIHIYDKRSNE